MISVNRSARQRPLCGSIGIASSANAPLRMETEEW